MQKHKKAIKNPGSVMKPVFAGTDAQKVKQVIQCDVRAGRGAMTSREAGAIRD
ncbi:hypothetical protein PDQ36_24440 [Bacillus cereus]|uniref:hypothetical protein n=1 Tax=Bacillus cereus group TaxID=86661 RepID=UPI0018C8B039|nr:MULTISPECIES: hypothetical protein [Bacillus cereus group]MCU7756596.1 hypothetical protein [Bacillus cereus]MDA2626389.1 hypothetical protein [Bacillus cereus]MDC7752651.1 hypothetical protein [Bacillus cereus]UXP17089.1 hypothetical protein N7988_28740 [Bacillus cereus]